MIVKVKCKLKIRKAGIGQEDAWQSQPYRQVGTRPAQSISTTVPNFLSESPGAQDKTGGKLKSGGLLFLK